MHANDVEPLRRADGSGSTSARRSLRYSGECPRRGTSTDRRTAVARIGGTRPIRHHLIRRARHAPLRGWVAGLLTLGRQLALVGGAALMYFGVRGLTESDHAVAVAHANTVLDAERLVGLDVEHAVQDLADGHPHVLTLFNWIYIWGHWPVIVVTFVWLYRTRTDTYRLLRDAMFVSGAIGLVIFATFPVAPPRLADLGLVDTVTDMSHSYRVLQPPALVNKYAAVPSLHVGWNLLVGLFVFRSATRAWLRWLGAISPVLMLAAVVVTANHFVIDGIIGAGVALAGLAIVLAARQLGRIWALFAYARSTLWDPSSTTRRWPAGSLASSHPGHAASAGTRAQPSAARGGAQSQPPVNPPVPSGGEADRYSSHDGSG